MGQHRPEPSQPAPNVGSAPNSRFLHVFGVPAAAAVRVPQRQLRGPSRDATGELDPQSPVSSSATVPMDQDEERNPVGLASQPLEQAASAAGQGEQALVPMAADDEDVRDEAAAPQEAARSEVVVVAHTSPLTCTM